MSSTNVPALSPSNRNEADAIIAVAREAEINRAPQITKLDGGLEVLVHRDGRLESLERHATRPRRKRALVSLYEVASFIDYVNRHKEEKFTHIFGTATEKAAGFRAVMDFHGDTTAAPGLARFAEHIVEVRLMMTPEWLRWLENDKKLLTQEQFAEFIEENILDIVEPDGAELLEIAQGLQGRKDVSFKSGKNLRDGSIAFEYSEQVFVNGSANRRDDTFKVPAAIKLALVPFVGANGVEIEARLRFRIGDGGKLSFAYVLNRPFKVIESAFLLARSEIEDATGIKVALGTGAVAPL